MKYDYKYKGIAEKIKEILQKKNFRRIKTSQMLNQLCLMTMISLIN